MIIKKQEFSVGYLIKHRNHDQSTHGNRRGGAGKLEDSSVGSRLFNEGEKVRRTWEVGNVNRTYKNGAINLDKYKKLKAAEKVKVLRFALSKHNEQYIKKADQPEKPSKKWKEKNSEIGKIEGIRRAVINKAEKLKGPRLRKTYWLAIALQRKATEFAELRNAA